MKFRHIFPLVFAWVLLHGWDAAFACSACYGQSDSSLAKGMNNGIFVLLGFIGMVLAGVASFFVFIIRRAASAPATPVAATATH